jgi:hypothetical protein
MNDMSKIRVVAQSLRRPQSVPGDRGWLRTLAARPVVFDLVSTAMQLRDLSRLKTIEDRPQYSDSHYDCAHQYNAGVTSAKIITRTRRAERLIPLLGFPPRDLARESFLSIGPRNVHEMLQAWLVGFRWKNISAIDLYSSNRKIQIMNMEEMSFADGTFDCLFSYATLSYAKDVLNCVGEFMRVLKVGGRAAFAHSHVIGATDFHGNAVTGEDVAEAIVARGGEIYYHNVHEKTISTGLPSRIHEFAVVRRN